MSTFRRITKHPETGEWKACWWLDDHFAHHHYGVQFDGEEKVFDPRKIDLEVKEHETLTLEELKALSSWRDELKDEPITQKKFKVEIPVANEINENRRNADPKYRPGDIVRLKNGKVRVVVGYSYYPFLGFTYRPKALFASAFKGKDVEALLGCDESVYSTTLLNPDF